MGKYKVCVYAICKNEEKFVDRWMDSMLEADRIVVLDTGSEDGTVEKLRARGAEVTVEAISPWRFDTARNRSLELVPEDADICVCTDLDEVFHPGWREAVEAAAGGVEASPSCTRRRPAETDGRLSSFPSASAGGVTWKGCLPSRRCGGGCCRNWEPPGWYAGRRLLSIQIRRARLFHMHLKWRRIVHRSAC